ncbi:MAG: DUF4190 domain-containing protein [Lachnospiraceae bacterium]|nr:DUF4190 domain-containing protein [Lachnospiraceae bacterium]
MDEKELYGQNQTSNQNQTYASNQTYNSNQAYNPNQTYNPNQGQPYQQSYSPQPAKAVVYDTMPMKNNNVAIAGLIIGIFALLGCWVPFWNLILAIAGIICSAIGLSHKGRSGMAIGGLVTSILALLISIVMSIIYLAAFSMA